MRIRNDTHSEADGKQRGESSRFFISEENITFPDSTFAEHARPSAHEAFGFISATTGFSPSLAVNKKKVSKK